MTHAGISRRMAVVIVSVPGAFVEPQLETAWPILLVVFYELILREAIDDHEQHQLRQGLAGWSAHLARGRLGGSNVVAATSAYDDSFAAVFMFSPSCPAAANTS